MLYTYWESSVGFSSQKSQKTIKSNTGNMQTTKRAKQSS